VVDVLSSAFADDADQPTEHLLRLVKPGTPGSVLLMEFGDYAMMRRILPGIRWWAESERQLR
jgi:hypothetical protein